MSRSASVELDFADGTHTFRLGWGELIKLQEATDAGPFVVYERLGAGGWRMQDISATIRLGLIGGGETPAAALKLVQDYVEDRPPLETRGLAIGVLAAGLMGAPDEPVGESSATPETAETV